MPGRIFALTFNPEGTLFAAASSLDGKGEVRVSQVADGKQNTIISPLSMAVSLEVVTRAEGAMADCLRRDLDLTRTSFAHGDVIEGIRARIIDKDNAPRWRFARIEDVSAAEVEKMFESPWPANEHPLRDLRG